MTTRPTVGVAKVGKTSVVDTSEFIGRIEAINRVSVVARVTAYLQQRSFVEGAEVRKNTALYRLEQGPFQADLTAKAAAVAQLQAMLENAKLTTERARTLLGGPAGQQSIYDAAIASQRSLEAQVEAAQANVAIAQINLDYTDIKSPIDGKIGRTSVTEGNVVGPNSGVLATIVSQDPMYVTFPVPVREAILLRDRYAALGGFGAVAIKIQLPSGKIYDRKGRLDFVNNTIGQGTDTIIMRGTVENPGIPGLSGEGARELTDGEFVSVFLEGVDPVEVLSVARSAVLTDQEGSYVFVVGPDDKVIQRRVTIGQSGKTVASITHGLQLGESVVVDGLQRIRPGEVVKPVLAPPADRRLMGVSMHGAAAGPNRDAADRASTKETRP
jgi:membrane fusion protein (multidrug efflux system)